MLRPGFLRSASTAIEGQKAGAGSGESASLPSTTDRNGEVKEIAKKTIGTTSFVFNAFSLNPSPVFAFVDSFPNHLGVHAGK